MRSSRNWISWSSLRNMYTVVCVGKVSRGARQAPASGDTETEKSKIYRRARLYMAADKGLSARWSTADCLRQSSLNHWLCSCNSVSATKRTRVQTTAVPNLLRQMMIFGFLTFWFEQYYSSKHAYKTSFVDTMTILFCLIYVGAMLGKMDKILRLWIGTVQ